MPGERSPIRNEAGAGLARKVHVTLCTLTRLTYRSFDAKSASGRTTVGVISFAAIGGDSIPAASASNVCERDWIVNVLAASSLDIP